jgi:hypothetical protein
MSQYPTYETEGGQASEAITYSRLCEHLRLAAECCYVLGHLRKANDDEVMGSGFLAIGQLLERVVTQVTKLATGSKFKMN